MRSKYKILLLQVCFIPLTSNALEEKECVVEFENNSSENIKNEENLNYCLNSLANKKIENIVTYAGSSRTGSAAKNKHLASQRAKRSILLIKERYPEIPVKKLNPFQMEYMGTKAVITFYYKDPAEAKNIALLETKISEMDMEIKNRDALLASTGEELDNLKKDYNDLSSKNKSENQYSDKYKTEPKFRIGSLFSYDTYYRESGINYLSLGTEFSWLMKVSHFRPEIGAKIKTSIPNLKISDNNVQVTNTYAFLGLGMSVKSFSTGLRVIGGKEWIKVPEKNIDKGDLAAGGEVRVGYETEKGPSIFLTYSLTNNIQMIGIDVGLSF
ncbi:hypothetical protein QEJ31_14695 [Pigmentibacter sp. JX0631]|uniref:hypothetical protein n=1 Tax=Pigmentibacter sp. JX0631 TaxID=2976982 RepID=UPI002469904A|nr:hypothetical protein [Pigmentibacter sp. JX0631]WGL59778.1 hypothetical protein QEJ31_14695 [Pigmentibacter sp. JX0631]